MPILWAAAEAAETGVIGQAMARAQAAQQDLVGLIAATGALIMGGIAYFFGDQPWAPPAYPACIAFQPTWSTWGNGGYDFSDSPNDVFDMNWVEAFDNQQTGGGNYNY